MLSSGMEAVSGVGDNPWRLIDPADLAPILHNSARMHKVLLIDSRSFLEFNTCHIQQSMNVCCSKLVKRRLQQDKVHIKDLLTQTCHIDTDETCDVIVYDQCSESTALLTEDIFLIVLLRKLANTFKSVTLLKGIVEKYPLTMMLSAPSLSLPLQKPIDIDPSISTGGFLGFQAMHPGLCESKTNNNYKHAPLTSLSQPCLPVSNIGPTRVLPFLYLGSQRDALSQDTVQVNGISYILNVSTTCPQPPFIQEGHFLRIPVNDNYSEKMQPFFQEAFQFLDKVRESNGCVLVHCLAGISRSPTLAIAYVMKNLHMSSDDAYRYVKDKRPTISPNFNFLGQLLDYEKQLRQEAKDAKSNTGKSTWTFKAETKMSPVVMDLCSPSSPMTKTNKLLNAIVAERSSLNSVSSSPRSPMSPVSSWLSSPTITLPVCAKSRSSGSSNSKTMSPLFQQSGSAVVSSSVCGLGASPSLPLSSMDCTDSGSTSTPPSLIIPKVALSSLFKAVPYRNITNSRQSVVMPKTATLPLLTTGACSGIKNQQTLPLGCNCRVSPQSPGKPFSFSPVAGTQTVHNIQSPTSALARLSFDSVSSPTTVVSSTTTKETMSHTSMETETPFQKFPTTSLDKLNFTPCFVKEEAPVRKKNGGTKRPLSTSIVEGKACESLHSPSSSSTSSGSSTTSPTTGQPKVVLRSRENKTKRSLVRPNSIAFSSYPTTTFDLGSDCQNSPCSSSSTSQDDSSDTYSSKKSKHSTAEQRMRGRYTEKHLYKQITAAMESAMIKTQAYGEGVSSRKARSLDDILNSGDEQSMDTACHCNSTLGKLVRRCGPRSDLFSPPTMFDASPCPYQSNSSISSSGSHSSLHGSLEIIQPPR